MAALPQNSHYYFLGLQGKDWGCLPNRRTETLAIQKFSQTERLKMFKFKVLFSMMVLTIGANSVYAEEWRSGWYGGAALTYSTGETTWDRSRGNRRNADMPGLRTPNLNNEGLGFSVNLGYDWSVFENIGLGVEASFLPKMGSTSSAESCPGSGRTTDQVCSASVSNSIQLGGRFLYELNEGSAILLRGGLNSAEITTRRISPLQSTGTDTEDRRKGAYVGVGYLLGLSNGGRISLDVSHHHFQSFDAEPSFDNPSRSGRNDVRSSTTVASLRYEFRL